MNDQLLLKDTEVAALLGIGRTTVWLYVSKRILPEPIKLGRSAYFVEKLFLDRELHC